MGRVGAFPEVVPTLPLLAEEPAFVLSAAEFAAKSAHELLVFITILNQNVKSPTQNSLFLNKINFNFNFHKYSLFLISQFQQNPETRPQIYQIHNLSKI